MKNVTKEFLTCLAGAMVVYCAGVVSYAMPDGLAWIFLDVYGILFWVNGIVALFGERKRRRDRARTMTCELFGHAGMTAMKDKGGQVVSLYCPKCDSHVGPGQSSDRKMEV
jgi:hypothetical protein